MPERLRAHYLEPVGLGDAIMGDIELMAAAKVAKVRGGMTCRARKAGGGWDKLVESFAKKSGTTTHPDKGGSEVAPTTQRGC